MAILEAELRTFLLGGATIAGKVAQRVYPQVLPQNVVYPAISYEPVSKPRLRDIEGPTGRALPRIRISCWAKTFVAAKELADDVRRRLDGYRGPMGAWRIGSSQLAAEIDLYDDTVQAHRTIVDFRLSYVES
mgnify:CR=1 FL=1